MCLVAALCSNSYVVNDMIGVDGVMTTAILPAKIDTRFEIVSVPSGCSSLIARTAIGSVRGRLLRRAHLL
jgi:hypothetical protein